MSETPEVVLARLAQHHAIAGPHASPVSRRFLSHDGLDLHYLDWPGSGEPIIFLHGGALTAHTWDLVALDLSSGFRCTALDLRGHGLSAWSDNYSIEASVQDVAALIGHLKLDRVHIVGMSLGGNIGAHYAALPNSRTVSLTMVDVGPWVDFGATTGMRDFMSKSIAHLTVEELVDNALAISASGGRDKILYRYQHMTHRLPDGSLSWRDDRRRTRDYPHILAKLDELAGLAPGMTCPALIVRGGRSRVLTDEKVERFARLFRDGRTALIEGAGHNVQEDRPRELAAILRAFLSSVPA